MKLRNFFAIMFLLVGALAFSACTDTETKTVTETVTETKYVCPDGSTAKSADMCPDTEPVDDYDEIGPGHEVGKENCYEDGDRDGMIAGTAMGDCIHGEEGDDSIKGMGGNDVLDGGPGDDTLDGGPGDDELIGGSGDNTLDGGEGADIAVYKNARRVVANLGNNMARVQHTTSGDVLLGGGSGIGTDTLRNIENVKGSLLGRDTINGDDNANVLKGLDQADIINGHGGDDTILPNRPANADGTANVADGTGSEIDGIDVVDGGKGSDTISYEGESTGVTIDLSATSTPGFVAAVADDPDTTDRDETIIAHFTATIGSVVDQIKVVNVGTEDDPELQSTIESVTGGLGDDALTGDARANTLNGGPGNDTLNGEANPAAAETKGGDDTLNGGAGTDRLNGGPGDDTLNGGAGTDTLNGNAGNDTLDGGGGADTLNGGAGNDNYIITKGNVDTITAFVVGDKIHLKGFADTDKIRVGTGNLNIQDPDDETAAGTPIVTISAGSNLIRSDTDLIKVEE